jgi:hypothetical protein
VVVMYNIFVQGGMIECENEIGVHVIFRGDVVGHYTV